VSFVLWERDGGKMSEKKLYEKPVLEYVGKMTEQTKAATPIFDGSIPQSDFKLE
jgi:hypothetical protein